MSAVLKPAPFTLAWSELPSAAGDVVIPHTTAWPDLIETIKTSVGYSVKAACPWLKLARFGTLRTPARSLRHDTNVLEISGIEGDYDGEQVTPDEALALLERAQVRAAIYTSPSHKPQAPRWRVLAPCSRPLPPACRSALVARINGVLGGILAGESFALSQSYYFGAVDGAEYRVLVTFDDPDEGAFIDELDELDELAIGKPAAGATDAGPVATGDDVFSAAVQRLGRKLRTGDGRREMLKTYIASRSARGLPAGDVRLLVAGIAARHFDPADPPSTDDVEGIVRWACSRDEAKRKAGAELAAGLHAHSEGSKAAAPGGQPAAPPPWRDVEIADLDDAVLPPPRWIWDGYIPAGELTLLGAHGGTGKSYIALMMAVSVALGLPLFGVDTEARPVLFYSAEDDADTVRRRLQAILRAMGVSAKLLSDSLRILDASRGPAELYGMTFNDEGIPKLGATAAADALRRELEGAAGALLIVDNASDTFGGNEIARVEVRAFVRVLVGMVRDTGGAVCLLAHVDKNTAKGIGTKQSYSGSTAWHNSARSRLSMSRDKDDTLLLEQEKSNHGPMREPLRLVWPRDGLPQLDAPVVGVVGHIKAQGDSKALIRLIHEFTERGEWISTATTSRTHAGKLLRGQPGFPSRLTDPELFDLLRTADRRGWLERALVRSSGRGHEKEVWRVTQRGADEAEIADFAPTAPTCADSEVGAPDPSGAEAAPTAPTSAPGGVGGRGARTSRRKGRRADLEVSS